MAKDRFVPISELKSDRLILFSGCSGGGKSALLDELGRRGYATCEEPGRAIVREQMASGGDALPWIDSAKFAERAARLSIGNISHATARDVVTFFDRGLVDAVCAMERMAHPVPLDIADAFVRLRYARTVFLAPPWKEIFTTDAERQHGFETALVEYDHLAQRLPGLCYEAIVLPKVSIEERAEFVLDTLGFS